MIILITGVHGFVGSNLVEYLKDRHTIYGLDIFAPRRDGVEKTFSWEDLENGNLPEVDAVVHLAGKAHDTKNEAMAEVYFRVNTGLTQKIYDWYLLSGARKFIFFSTAKAAADKVEGILTEKVVPQPVGPYGESKIRAEEYIMGKDSIPDGKQFYILRPCMIHGPGNKGNLNLLFSVVKRGIPWPLGAFENLRTFTSVENVCFAVEGLLQGNAPDGIYNMGDDEPVSTNDLIGIICAAMGKKARIWRIPQWLMKAAAKIGGWLHLPLNPERLRKLTENYVSSNDKIKKALGVEKLPVEAKEGLRKTIESFNL